MNRHAAVDFTVSWTLDVVSDTFYDEFTKFTVPSSRTHGVSGLRSV